MRTEQWYQLPGNARVFRQVPHVRLNIDGLWTYWDQIPRSQAYELGLQKWVKEIPDYEPSGWHPPVFESGHYIIRPKLPLTDYKTTKQQEIRDKADEFLSRFAEEYGVFERQTWDKQLRAAEVYTKTGTASTLLQSIATERGVTIDELVNRILRNDEHWSQIAGIIVGQRLRFQDMLDAATTLEEVEAIKPTYSLPEGV